jgi:hypothetical protein
MAGKGWDLTSTNSLQGAAKWLLKLAGGSALVVIVVRVDDLAIAADPLVSPRDTLGLLADRYPELHDTLQAERVKELEKRDRQRAKGGR